MVGKEIPVIDLEGLTNDRDTVLSDIKHAVVEYGFFYIKNYNEYLDHNVISAVDEQAKKFFQLSDDEKNEIEMVKSKHFLGYNGLGKENTSGRIDLREQIDFCSLDRVPSESNNIHDNLIGPNQYPSSDSLPLFKKSIKDFFFYLNEFSILITKILLEALEIEQYEADRYFNFDDAQNQFAKMKVVHYPSKVTLKEKDILSDQGCGAHRDSGFLTFLFQTTLTETSLQVQDIYGNWIDVTPKPKTIIVNVGQTLEYLTSGVCISSIHRVLSPKHGSRISIPYFTNVKLDSKLQPFTLSTKLLKERDERDRARTQNVGFQYKPKSGEPISKSIFYNRLKAHTDVASKWYPEIQKQIDLETNSKQRAANSLSKETKSEDLLIQLHRLKKIFAAMDNTIVLSMAGRTADIKLVFLLPQIKSLTKFNVEIEDLLRIVYIWPESIDLKLDEAQDFIIDIDSPISIVGLKDIPRRARTFEDKLTKWFDDNKENASVIPIVTKSVIKSKLNSSSPRKKFKGEILQKVKVNATKPEKEQNGLTLLERIKRKEKANTDKQVSPEEKYELYLDSKLHQVLEVFAALRPDRTYSITGLTDKIINSLSMGNDLAKIEANDLVLHLSKRFPDLFKIVESTSVTVMKWKDFDVNELKRNLLAT